MASAGVLAPATRPATLTVLYDDGCRVCVRASGWLARQPTYVPLLFVPAGSTFARAAYPQLDPEATLRDLVVVADTGAVYQGANAWVMCLWALREHRQLAYVLSTPAMAPRARRFIAWFSAHRGWLGSVA